MRRYYPHGFVEYFHDITTNKNSKIPPVYRKNLSIDTCYKKYLLRQYQSFFIEQYQQEAFNDYKRNWFLCDTEYQYITKNEINQIIAGLKNKFQIKTLNDTIRKHLYQNTIEQLTDHEIKEIVIQFININRFDLNRMIEIIRNSIFQIIRNRIPDFIARKIVNYVF